MQIFQVNVDLLCLVTFLLASGSDEDNDKETALTKGVGSDEAVENASDDNKDGDDDEEEEDDGLDVVSSITVGDLIQAMKTKVKAATTSQPSSLVTAV